MIHTLRQTSASLQQFNRAVRAMRRERSTVDDKAAARIKRIRKIANASRRQQRRLH
jgi:hypothetical protein